MLTADTALQALQTYQPLSHRHGTAARLLCDAVDDCCDDVADSADLIADLPPDSSSAEALRVLGSLVAEAVKGQPLAHLALPPQRNLQPLLQRLRQRFTQLAMETAVPLTGREVLRTLGAFDRVQRRIDSDAAQRFAGQLSSADAMDLVVAVAHDMRSPLSSILFLVDAIRSGMSGPVTPQQQQQLLLVYSAAFGLSSLTGDVMSLARGGERLSQEAVRPFSVRDCMQSVRDIVLPIAAERRLDLVIAPPAADRRMGHPIVLNRVLLNLATNALKFTEQGTVRVEAQEVSRTHIEFAVSDTGRGIPDDVVASMFNAFRRRTPDQSYVFSSSGLGLALCQKLVAAMGGELQVASAVGVGTRFHFRLELPVVQRL